MRSERFEARVVRLFGASWLRQLGHDPKQFSFTYQTQLVDERAQVIVTARRGRRVYTAKLMFDPIPEAAGGE